MKCQNMHAADGSSKIEIRGITPKLITIVDVAPTVRIILHLDIVDKLLDEPYININIL